jgi:hypothetical protein
MSFPLVLLQPGVRNESQDTELTTVKLTPNAHSQFQTRFVIPKNGSVLDSNSALVWRIDWTGYDDTLRDNEKVTLKTFAGGLPTLRRARFYIGGREIFSSQDVGHLIHIKRLAANPDYMEEMIDKEVGAAHGYSLNASGQFKLTSDAPGLGGTSKRFVRQLGSGTKGIECSVLLSDIFSALESLQLPMALDQMRIEIDWETSFDEVATVVMENDGSGANPVISDARKKITINDPVLLLDYLTYNEELRAGLGQVLQDGMVLPYIHTSMSTKVLPAQAVNTTKTDDVLLALQGKLLMKMYVSHRFSDSVGGATQAYQLLQGRCRSQRGQNMKYNLFINDLALHDQPVDTDSQQYSFLEMTHQAPVSAMPGTFEYNATNGVAPTATNSFIDGAFTLGGIGQPTAVAATQGLTATQIKDGLTGVQSYIGFDLSKYDEGSRVVPANAGYRVGSSAVILRLTQDSKGVNTPETDPKTIQVFTEEVRVLQVRGGIVDTMEA